MASWKGKHQVVELLLARGADVDSKNKVIKHVKM